MWTRASQILYVDGLVPSTIAGSLITVFCVANLNMVKLMVCFLENLHVHPGST